MLRWWKTFMLIDSDILASRVVVKKITLWMKDIAWCRESWCLLLSFFCRCCHAPHQPPMAKFFSLHKLKMYSRTVRDCCSEAFLWINVLYVFLYRLKNKPEKQEPPLTSQKNEETKPGKKKTKKTKQYPGKHCSKAFILMIKLSHYWRIFSWKRLKS